MSITILPAHPVTSSYKVTNKEDADYDNAKIFFYGAVSEGESFDVSAAMADENDLGSKIFVHIYDANGNTLLQTVEIHTSCSAPLIEGERFGSLETGWCRCRSL